MVTYEFYSNSYLGSAIPENAFSGVAARAEEILARMKRIYQIQPHGEVAEQLAVCSIAEGLYAHKKRQGGIAAASMGQVSVRYEDSTRSGASFNRELLRRASIYLDIYRGVE